MSAGLLYALGFLTRVPVPTRVFGDARARLHSLAWYPVVGAILGVLLGLLAACLPGRAAGLEAALLVSAWAWLTGGLHLDGLADSADAWVGGLGDRERTLAIMKDPRSGPAGVSALVLLLLLKFAALASLPTPPLAALMLAPVLARAALTAAFLCTSYVRPGGTGSGLAEAPRAACLIVLLASAALPLLLGLRGLLALAAALLVFWLWRRACLRRLGGITGDTCGALTEMVEAAVLVALAL